MIRAAMLAAVAAAGVVLALWLSDDAGAHAPHRVHAGLELEVLERRLERNVAHSAGAVRWLEQRRLGPRARARLVWHRRALHGWQLENLEAVRAAIRARARAAAVSSFWLTLADCETGGDRTGRPPWAPVWGYDGPSGFDGGLQFHPGTWAAYRRAGEPLYAWQASAAVQVAVAERVLAEQGLGAWPDCSYSTGLR